MKDLKMVELKFSWKKEKIPCHNIYKAKPVHSKAERDARHLKFLKKLDHIIKAEKQNGSLVNLPSSNETLKSIQHENDFFNDEEDKVKRIDPAKSKMILDLITRGYSLTISQHLAHASATTIKRVMCDAGVKLRPVFKYRLKSIEGNKLDFYARNIRQLSSYLGLSSHLLKNNGAIAAKGYKLLKVNKLWYQLPNNVAYSANDAETIYLKKGIHSFENKEFKVQRTEVR